MLLKLFICTGINQLKRVMNGVKTAYQHQAFYPRWWSIFVNSFYFSRKGLLSNIAKHAGKLNGVLLDFGCGSKPYRELFKVQEYIGLDIEQSSCNHHESNVDIFYDGKTIPFADNHFDSIFCSEVIEHIFNLDGILSELHRVLKSQGRMLITTPFCWDQHLIPYDFARYTEFGLKHVLESHGFEVISHSKSTTYIETITQLIGIYVYKTLCPDYKVISKLLHITLVAPVFLLGILASKLLPNNGHLYLNHIVLVKKV